jgi:ribosome-binding ATPase YchF (GTP1/OBG family)
LSHIQAVDGLYHVVRAFDNDEIVHVDDSVDPVRDLETIQTELCKKDLVWFEQALGAEDLAVKKSQGKMKLSPLFITTMEKVRAHLEGGVGLFGPFADFNSHTCALKRLFALLP